MDSEWPAIAKDIETLFGENSSETTSYIVCRQTEEPALFTALAFSDLAQVLEGYLEGRGTSVSLTIFEHSLYRLLVVYDRANQVVSDINSVATSFFNIPIYGTAVLFQLPSDDTDQLAQTLHELDQLYARHGGGGLASQILLAMSHASFTRWLSSLFS